jgi:hypothetical protein
MWEELTIGLAPFVLALLYLTCRRQTPPRADPALVVSFAVCYKTITRDGEKFALCCRLSYVAEDDAYALDAYHMAGRGELHFAGRVQVTHAELCHMAGCSPTPARPCDTPTSGAYYMCCVVGCRDVIGAAVTTYGCRGCAHPDAGEAFPEEIVAYLDRFGNYINNDISLIEITSTDKISNQVLTTGYSRTL